MKIIDRWNEFMGPKDERLAAESNRCAALFGYGRYGRNHDNRC